MSNSNNGEICLKIDDLAFGGSGVGRHEGKVWFVPFTIPGEVVRAREISRKKSFTEGRLLEVCEASERRVEPRCAWFGICGGCTYQHMDYQLQLEWKVRQVRTALERIAGLGRADSEELKVLPDIHCIPSPQPYGYRNRISLRVWAGRPGFQAVNGRDFVPIERCEIAAPAINDRLQFLRKRKLADGRLTLRTHPGRKGFTQTNDEAAALLRNEVASMVPDSGQRLIDAYCGAGFFSKALRDRFQEVCGIEWSEPALELAREETSPHEYYRAGDVEAELPSLLTSGPPTEVIVDPPRDGLSASVCASLRSDCVTGITYVSCNPSTLARDLARLGAGWQIERLTVVDMFPQTAEIECAARLVRRKEANFDNPSLR
jgi:23S rRNA (uracil1939-C5)-methyltransferase